MFNDKRGKISLIIIAMIYAAAGIAFKIEGKVIASILFLIVAILWTIYLIVTIVQKKRH